MDLKTSQHYPSADTERHFPFLLGKMFALFQRAHSTHSMNNGAFAYDHNSEAILSSNKQKTVVIVACNLFPDAVKRRKLPAWIREGLEKMDREKQKKLEQERMEKERAEMAKNDGEVHEADEGCDGPRVPRKSKFVSYLMVFSSWEGYCCTVG